MTWKTLGTNATRLANIGLGRFLTNNRGCRDVDMCNVATQQERAKWNLEDWHVIRSSNRSCFASVLTLLPGKSHPADSVYDTSATTWDFMIPCQMKSWNTMPSLRSVFSFPAKKPLRCTKPSCWNSEEVETTVLNTKNSTVWDCRTSRAISHSPFGGGKLKNLQRESQKPSVQQVIAIWLLLWRRIVADHSDDERIDKIYPRSPMQPFTRNAWTWAAWGIWYHVDGHWH